MLSNFRTPKYFKFPQQSGRLPNKRLFERSRTLVAPSVVPQRKDLNPLNVLLERYNATALDRESGTGPWNWLKLKLTEAPDINGKFGKVLLMRLEDRSRYSNLREILENQLGIASEIPELEISNLERLN